MDFFRVLSVEEVKLLIKENFNNIKPETEMISLLSSIDRIIAENTISPCSIPQFDKSTVDGYAVRSFDTHGASDNIPVMLELIGEVFIGQEASMDLSSSQAVYVPTGGMIPKGADSVIMIEHINKLDDQTIEIFKPVAPGENIIYAGDDIKIDDIVYKKGKRINAQDIGTLSAMGISKVPVLKKPLFYIISTGDEIIEPDMDLSQGKIRDINGYALFSLIQKAGGEIVNRVIVRDDFESLRKEVRKALNQAEIILISGGSSVGTRDYTNKVINSFDGKGVFVHGVSIKPGKPTIIGEIENKAVFGLPGHPVSAIMVFKVFIEFLFNYIMGIKKEVYPIKAIISSNVHSSPGSITYKMVILRKEDDSLYADISYGKSGMITMMSRSHGYIIIDEAKEGLNEGEEVSVYLL